MNNAIEVFLNLTPRYDNLGLVGVDFYISDMAMHNIFKHSVKTHMNKRITNVLNT